MTVLVTGSRGRVASTLLGLLDAEGIPARAASRDPENPSPPSGAAAVRCDLTDPATFDAALEGVDSVFLYAEAAPPAPRRPPRARGPGGPSPGGRGPGIRSPGGELPGHPSHTDAILSP